MKTLRTIRASLLAIGTLAWFTVGALGAEVNAAPQTETSTMPPAPAQSVDRATQMLGAEVRTRAGETLGRIRDILLTGKRDAVESYVVSLTEDAAGHTRLVSLPRITLERTADGQAFLCSLSHADVTAEPEFAAQGWPQILATRRVSQLIGLEAQDSSGERFGHVRDLLIASTDGQITQATIGVGGVLGLGEKFASVDWHAVTIAANGDSAMLAGLSAGAVKDMAYAEKDYWQHLGFAGEKQATEPSPVKMPSAPKQSAY